MAKGRDVEQVLTELAALRGRPVTDQTRQQIAKGLASKVSFVAAKAADMAREMKVTGVCSELRQAFDRFLADAKSSDKGCAAKTAIARAALELECSEEAIFLAGIQHYQMESSFGGPVDVAAELRGLSALGLVQVRSRGAMYRVVELLNDRQTQARIGAVRALACAGREEGVLVLRFKALAGDPEPAVVGECLTALVSLQPREALEFVGSFFESPQDAIREEAALALGTSKNPAALDLLKAQFRTTFDRQFRQTLLTAIASLRVAPAVDFLVSVIQTERAAVAADALAAARIFRHDSTIRERIGQAILARNDAALRMAFHKEFEDGSP